MVPVSFTMEVQVQDPLPSQEQEQLSEAEQPSEAQNQPRELRRPQPVDVEAAKTFRSTVAPPIVVRTVVTQATSVVPTSPVLSPAISPGHSPAVVVTSTRQSPVHSPTLAPVAPGTRVVSVHSPTSARVVTPYSQIYGQHPNSFDFDRRGRMQPSAQKLEEIKAMARESVDIAAEHRQGSHPCQTSSHVPKCSVRQLLQSDPDKLEDMDAPLSPKVIASRPC
eukprot:TRINITY_DN61320_c0_g1_i1.p1 TRINITY_DN61320_c0_g1~~TRINITY_DN61320_c0_g1_i1.p1  ORF type:complete len:222 (+),score=22.01 TRINITY_DN61320_c0_g1_i1:16-681(+)